MADGWMALCIVLHLRARVAGADWTDVRFAAWWRLTAALFAIVRMGAAPEDVAKRYGAFA